jgi:hypothetical protein
MVLVTINRRAREPDMRSESKFRESVNHDETPVSDLLAVAYSEGLRFRPRFQNVCDSEVINVEQICRAQVSIMKTLMCEVLGNLSGSGL